MLQHKTMSLCLAMMMALLLVCPASASLVNGDFDSGLSGWSSGGATQATGGAAQLGDGTAGEGASLFQIAAFTPGQYTFSFDFKNGLSSAVSTGTFADAFFTSLYFVNAPGDFDLANPLASEAVLGLDYTGAQSLQGVLSASALGAGWTHLSFSFTHTYAYIIPYFELIDLNFVDNDSLMLLENVQIEAAQAVVPEPATIALVGLGLGAASRLRNRRFKRGIDPKPS